MRIGGAEVDGEVEHLAALFHRPVEWHENAAGYGIGDYQVVELLVEAEIL